MMNHRPIVFLDIETTGGHHSNSRISDIGALRVENGKVVKTMNQLINPEEPIPYFITKLTGITNEMSWSAPTFSAIAQELEQLLSGAIFAAHYAKFDYGFIKTEFKRLRVNLNMNQLCTVKLDRALYPNQSRHGLDQVIKRMELDVANRHRGFDDAEVLWKLFDYEKNKDEINLFSKINRVLKYTKHNMW